MWLRHYPIIPQGREIGGPGPAPLLPFFDQRDLSEMPGLVERPAISEGLRRGDQRHDTIIKVSAADDLARRVARRRLFNEPRSAGAKYR